MIPAFSFCSLKSVYWFISFLPYYLMLMQMMWDGHRLLDDDVVFFFTASHFSSANRIDPNSCWACKDSLSYISLPLGLKNIREWWSWCKKEQMNGWVIGRAAAGLWDAKEIKEETCCNCLLRTAKNVLIVPMALLGVICHGENWAFLRIWEIKKINQGMVLRTLTRLWK